MALPRRLTKCFARFKRVLRGPLESAQYCSIEYEALLRKHSVLISMSGKGNCYDNAMVETFFKTLKSEGVWRTGFDFRSEATRTTGGYIDGFYNPKRRLSALDFSSPIQYEIAAMN